MLNTLKHGPTTYTTFIFEIEKQTYWDICSRGTSFLKERTTRVTSSLFEVGTTYLLDGNYQRCVCLHCVCYLPAQILVVRF